MSGYNRVVLVGNVTRDVDLRYIPSGTAVADLGLAVNDVRNKERDETVFVDVTVWARLAEIASQYLSKGDPVLIEGRLKLDKWQDNDGNNRQKLKVVCEKLKLLSGKGRPSSENSSDTNSENKVDEIDVDDVPF